MNFTKPGKLVFIGDSITDAGRDVCGEHTPWCPDIGFGRGYVMMVNALIQSTRPDSRIRIINRGNSGNTIRDLSVRWQTDVLDLKPDCLVVCIGINDVWRQFDSHMREELAVPPGDYAAIYAELLSRTLPAVEEVILMSPFMIEPNRSDAMRARMDEYGEIVRDLASRHNLCFVDLQAVFDGLTIHIPVASLAWDRIHPSPVGHMAIARALLKAIDFHIE